MSVFPPTGLEGTFPPASAGSGSGASSWGGITGTLSAQTDLQSALDGKQAAGSYAAASHTHAQSDVTGLTTALAGKQDTLVSGTSIKTVNGNSLLGSGNLSISGGGGSSPILSWVI